MEIPQTENVNTSMLQLKRKWPAPQLDHFTRWPSHFSEYLLCINRQYSNMLPDLNWGSNKTRFWSLSFFLRFAEKHVHFHSSQPRVQFHFQHSTQTSLSRHIFLINSSQLRLHQNQILSPVVRVAKLGLDWCLVPKVAENKCKYKHIDKRQIQTQRHRQKQASWGYSPAVAKSGNLARSSRK